MWLLEKPSQVTDTSWIKPGKVAWDWWNALERLWRGLQAGVNTATYKYFIDFAAKYNIPYIILDEGWYKLGNVLDVVPQAEHGGAGSLRQTEERRADLVGDLEIAGRSTGTRLGSIRESGA